MSEWMLDELRAVKPVASRELRERVRTIAAAEPARSPFRRRLEWRRSLVVLAPATLVAAVAAAGVLGLTRGDVASADEQAASGGAATTTLSLDSAKTRQARESGA